MHYLRPSFKATAMQKQVHHQQSVTAQRAVANTSSSKSLQGQESTFKDERPEAQMEQELSNQIKQSTLASASTTSVLQPMYDKTGKEFKTLVEMNAAIGALTNKTNYPADGLTAAHFSEAPTAQEIDDAIEALSDNVYEYIDVNDLVESIDAEIQRVRDIPEPDPVTIAWTNAGDDETVEATWPKLFAKLQDPSNYDDVGKPVFNACHVDDTGAAQWKLQADQELMGAGSVDRLHLNVVPGTPVSVTVVKISYNTH